MIDAQSEQFAFENGNSNTASTLPTAALDIITTTAETLAYRNLATTRNTK